MIAGRPRTSDRQHIRPLDPELELNSVRLKMKNPYLVDTATDEHVTLKTFSWLDILQPERLERQLDAWMGEDAEKKTRGTATGKRKTAATAASSSSK